MNFMHTYISAFGKFSLLALALTLLPLSQSFTAAVQVLQNAAVAQDEEEDEGRRAPPAARSSQTLSRRVYERLEEIMEYRDAEDFENANLVLGELREMYDQGRLNDAETTRMWQFFANLASLDENYDLAIEYMENILAQGEEAITPELQEDTLLRLGMLNFAVEDYQSSIDYYLRYLDFSLEPDIEPYLRIASAYYTTEQYEEAVPYLLEYMDLSRAAGEEIDRSTYLLLRAVYTTLEQYENSLQVTREMIVLYREQDDWTFMVNILGALERFTEQASFLYAMKNFGYLEREGQINNLAAQLFNEGYYWGSAKTLEFGAEQDLMDELDFDYWSNLGQSYQFAREDEMALEPLANAAELDDSGDTYSRLATAYINLGRFADAVPAFGDAFAKGDLNRPDQTYLRQAQVFLNLNRFDEATEAARMAGELDERSEDAAATWVQYINNERNLYETKERNRELYDGFFRDQL